MQTIDITERDENGLHAFLMTLRPRRSADPRVAYGFCGVLGFIWFCAAIFISWMGGWPVIGFFGLEFVFIACMVHIFIRRTEVVETVEITQQYVTVKRRDLAGEDSQTFPAYWAQIHYSGSASTARALEIRSHGDAVEIGKFLSASEKNRTASVLDDVLHRLRHVTTPPPETA